MSTSETKRRRGLAVAGAAVLGDLAFLRARGYPLGGNVVVRCSQGHRFETIWLPAASLKSIRLGPWRFQRCPVGRHWAFVTPVDRSALSSRQRRAARRHRDIRIP
jgi:hypothetical protein